MSARKGWLTAALSVVLAGATGVQASSTWKLGHAHHLADVALPFLILTLEVGSVTAAALYVITRDTGTRVRAGVVLFLVAGLGWWGGLQVYGVLVATVVTGTVLFLVDIIGRFWHEPEPVDQPVDDAIEAELSPAVDEPGDGVTLRPGESVEVASIEVVDPITEPIDVSGVEVAERIAAIEQGWELPEPEVVRPEPTEPDRTTPEPERPSEGDPATRAAEIIAAADERPSEHKLLTMLRAEGYDTVTKYQCKKFLGNTTRRAAELETIR